MGFGMQMSGYDVSPIVSNVNLRAPMPASSSQEWFIVDECCTVSIQFAMGTVGRGADCLHIPAARSSWPVQGQGDIRSQFGETVVGLICNHGIVGIAKQHFGNATIP